MPPFRLSARAKSFRHAFAGIAFMLRTQHNAWIHGLATVAVIAAGFALRIEAADWKWLILTVTLVWVAETMNTAFEHLCDVVSPQYSEAVKRAKDVAAGAVLICAGGAAAIGALIFLPYVRALGSA